MSTRNRPSRRWRQLQRRLLAHGPARVALAAGLVSAVLALALSQGVLVALGAPFDARTALAALLGAVLIVPAVVWPLMRLLHGLEEARARLDVLATRDELTGVHNRRQFMVLADREWARCRRYEMGAALLMLDVDHFKRVNDLHGHLAGDLMLREIARAAGDTLRQADLIGRFGGEEFVVFLPHTDTLGALDAAERIRERVAAIALEWRGQDVRTTASLGVATLAFHHDSLSALLADADRALYAAKHAGRNCIRTATALHEAGAELGAEMPWSSPGATR